MPILIKARPSRSTNVFLKWITHLCGNTGRKKTPSAPRSWSSAHEAQRVFVLTLHHLVNKAGMKQAKFLAWLHFGLGRNSKHLISAEIVKSGKHHTIARTYDRKSTVKLARALRIAVKKQTQSSKYSSIRLLKIPPLIGLAIWLRGRTPENDLIVPVESCVDALKRGKAYRLSDILLSLRARARALADQSAALQSGLRKKGSWLSPSSPKSS